jgi:hypothetical protein
MPADLTPSQIALLLDEVYGRAGQGWPPELRPWQLAHDLSCHPKAHAAAWALWATELELTGRDLGKPGGWLDSDFSKVAPGN